MLYVSNTTKQTFAFNYREPRRNLMLTLRLPSGRQEVIGHDWSVEEKGAVIKQLERFGARDAAEAHGKLENFLGLLYRVGDPVDSEEIEMGHAAVVETQEQRSVREATRSGLAFDRAARAETAKRKGRPARTTTIEVEQELAPHAHPTGNEVRFSMTVDPEGQSNLAPPT